jgi:hypothetical protein
MRRLKQLEDENSKLTKLVAVICRWTGPRNAAGRHPQKAVRPVRKRELVDAVCKERKVSIGQAFSLDAHHAR